MAFTVAELQVVSTALTQMVENADPMADEPTAEEIAAQRLLERVNEALVAALL